MLSVTEATQRIRSEVAALEPETVALDEALDRYMYADVRASRDLPPFDNSAMDGFAVRAAEVPGTLPIAIAVAAGDAPAALEPGAAARIMTGAPVPAGADSVVMREEVDDRGQSVHIDVAVERGQHVRRAGEDIAAKEVAVKRGARLGPGEIGLLAAQGVVELAVTRRPRVAILGTGDELVSPDTEPGAGQIVNSNAFALAAQVREAGGVPVDLGIVADTRAASIEALRRAAEHDVILTSGGVSVGDFDFVKEALCDAGFEILFWKVAIKPGKPLVFARGKNGALLFGLPGNPVSSMTSFELFVRPALLAMQGATVLDRARAPVVLATPYRKRPGRAHYVRARLSRAGERIDAHPHPKQGSGMLTSMVGVDAFLELEAELGDRAAGDTVPALLLRPI